MRTEISINDLSVAGHRKSVPSQAIALDTANGIRVKLDNRGTRGLIVKVTNTGAAQKNITVLPPAPNLVATAIIPVPAGEAVELVNIGQSYASHGGVDFDFEAGFTGKIAAFRLPGER